MRPDQLIGLLLVGGSTAAFTIYFIWFVLRATRPLPPHGHASEESCELQGTPNND